MQNLGIEFISVFGLPPVAFVELAAGLGCRHISLALQPIDYNPEGYPTYGLRQDRALRRSLIGALADHGVTISSGEGLCVLPGADQRESWMADLEVMRELGVERINAVSFEPDLDRNIEQFGMLAETASQFGIGTLLEFVPSFGVADLPTALRVLRGVGRADLRLTIDTMHVARSGAKAADLAALDPDLVGYVQLCDAPLSPANSSYLEEAMYERLPPGEGELPLSDILAGLPGDRVIGLEVPMRVRADAGMGPRERLAPCVAGARALLARL